MPSDHTHKNINGNSLIICCLILLAFAFRAAFLWFQPYSGDEATYVNIGVHNLFNHFDPNNFIHPALYYYFTSFLYGIFFLTGHFLRFFQTDTDFLIFFLNNPQVFFALARLISVSFSVLTIYLVYRISRKWFSPPTVYAIVLLMVVSYPDIWIAREASMYSMSSFLVLLAWFFLYRLQSCFNLKNFLVAAFTLGLAFSSDFYALLLVPLTIWLINNKGDTRILNTRSSFDRIILFFGISLSVFVIFNPFFIFNFYGFLRDSAFQYSTIYKADLGRTYQPWFYLSFFVKQGVWGVFVLMSFIIGSFHILFHDRKKWLLLIYPWMLFIAFSLFHNQANRYAANAMPFVFLIVGNLLDACIGFTKKSFKRIFYVFLVLVAFSAFSKDLMLFTRGNDPINFYREQSHAWTKAHIPKGSGFLMYINTIPFIESRLMPLLTDKRKIKDTVSAFYGSYPELKDDYRLHFFDRRMLEQNSYPEFIRKNNIDYVILSDRDEEAVFLEWLRNKGVFLKGFGPYNRGDRNFRFHIRVYDVRDPVKFTPPLEKAIPLQKKVIPVNKIWHFIFLPMIIFIGIKTASDDFASSKIANKLVILGILYSFLIYALCWSVFFISRVAPMPAIFSNMQISLLYGFDKWCVNLALAVIAAYLLWHFNMWGAGDAKLFICYASLIPIGRYSKIYFHGYFASFFLLLAIFIPAAVFLFFKAVTYFIRHFGSYKFKKPSWDMIIGKAKKVHWTRAAKVVLGFFVFFLAFRFIVPYFTGAPGARQGFALWIAGALKSLVLVIILVPVFKKMVDFYVERTSQATTPFALWMFLGVLLVWFF